jgi:hypothetical protein
VFDRDLGRREDDPLAEDLVRVAFHARNDVDS